MLIIQETNSSVFLLAATSHICTTIQKHIQEYLRLSMPPTIACNLSNFGLSSSFKNAPPLDVSI